MKGKRPLGKPSTHVRYKPKVKAPGSIGRPVLFGNSLERKTLNIYVDLPTYDWICRKAVEETKKLPLVWGERRKREGLGPRVERIGYGEIVRRAIILYMEAENARAKNSGEGGGHAHHVPTPAETNIQTLKKRGRTAQ